MFVSSLDTFCTADKVGSTFTSLICLPSLSKIKSNSFMNFKSRISLPYLAPNLAALAARSTEALEACVPSGKMESAIHPISSTILSVPTTSMKKKKLRKYPGVNRLSKTSSKMKMIKIAKRTEYKMGSFSFSGFEMIHKSGRKREAISKIAMID